jgi:hypothetical protein
MASSRSSIVGWDNLAVSSFCARPHPICRLNFDQAHIDSRVLHVTQLKRLLITDPLRADELRGSRHH